MGVRRVVGGGGHAGQRAAAPRCRRAWSSACGARRGGG
jgi:hypothetical protein